LEKVIKLHELDYKPRLQFAPYHERTERFAKIVAHRRFGKTVGCINEKIRAAFENRRAFPPPRYSYVAPTYTQAKDIAWGYLKHYSAVFPGLKMSESELWVELPHNGARIRLYGADNYDRMRGLYNDGVTIDEPAQMDPRAWPEVIRPTLSDYLGWASFIGTPRGKDWFYRIDKSEDGKPLDDFYRLTLRASETGIIPPAELASLRAGMSEDQYNREMECSFDAAVEGAYFARLMAQAKPRICRVSADPLLPLRAYIDIGGSGRHADAFTIWIVQFVGQEIRVLDYYEAIGQVLGFHVAWLRKNGYEDAVIQLPHDGVNENNITGKRYEDHFREAQFKVNPSLPNQGKGAAQMRIEAVRRIMPKCWFNESTTEAGREALVAYHEKRDEERNVGLGPEHDWSSHAADAFGLMAICYEEPSRSAGFGRAIDYGRAGVA
jgi:phage terminase large subunit